MLQLRQQHGMFVRIGRRISFRIVQPLEAEKSLFEVRGLVVALDFKIFSLANHDAAAKGAAAKGVRITPKELHIVAQGKLGRRSRRAPPWVTEQNNRQP